MGKCPLRNGGTIFASSATTLFNYFRFLFCLAPYVSKYAVLATATIHVIGFRGPLVVYEAATKGEKNIVRVYPNKMSNALLQPMVIMIPQTRG